MSYKNVKKINEKRARRGPLCTNWTFKEEESILVSPPLPKKKKKIECLT
jgi:hypothetical protein